MASAVRPVVTSGLGQTFISALIGWRARGGDEPLSLALQLTMT